MSGTWNDPSLQQPAPGPVKLFDPTQFQTPMSVPSSGAPASQAGYSQPAQTAYNSWNSWGSWDWNPDNSNTSTSGRQGVAATSAGSGSDQKQFHSDSSGHIPQYSQAWNQGWDGAGSQQHTGWDSSGQQQNHHHQQQQLDWGMAGQEQQQQQYSAYDQLGAMNGPHSHQQFQQYRQNPEEAAVPNHYGSHQFYNDQFYNQQSQQDFPFHQQPQQQQQGQTFPSQQQGQNFPPQHQQELSFPHQQQQELNFSSQQQLEQSFPPQQQQEQNFSPQQQQEQNFSPQQQQDHGVLPQQQDQSYSQEPVISPVNPPEEASRPQHFSLDQAQYQHQQFHQGVSVDQGQHLQQQQQPYQQEYYDQPHEASSWAPTPAATGEWGSSDTQSSEAVKQPDSTQTDSAHSMSVEDPLAVPLQKAPVLEGTDNVAPQQRDPVLDAFDENDNDGTVSGFFGRDDDGDIPSESPRLGRWSDSGNQLPVQQPSIHRTHSDISNASLMTLNFPQNEGDEDNGDPLHHVQELVQRMEATHLARAASEARGSQSASHQFFGMSGDSIAGEVPGDVAVTLAVNDQNPSGSGDHVGQQGHIRGDYSGFGNETSNFNMSNKPEHPNLPLDTNMRPASPDGDDQPGSGGSGASGGSSGLADWEIVPSQTSSRHSHSGNSSLDNGVAGTGGGFFTDRPDGGMASSNNSAASATVSDLAMRASGDGLQSAVPLESDTGIPPGSTKSQLSTNQSMVGQGDGRSDADSIVSQHPPVDTQPSISTAPPPPMISVPPQGSSGSANPFRRDGNKSPRHAGLAQPTNTASAMPPPPVPTATSMPQQQEKLQGSGIKEQGLSALPSRPKPPQVSSTEDGIPARRREPDRGAGKKPSHDSSTSSQDRPRHHSAFHPVNRPRLTTMSPATTLWDQEEAPSTNILLAPAMPLIIPALNPFSKSAAATSTSDKDSLSTTANKHGGTTSVEASRSREKPQAEVREVSSLI